MKKILLVTIIFITCILNSQSLYARQSHTLYKINQEDANNIVAISSIFYFSMIGYNTGGLPKMAMSLLQDLDTITGFDLFSNRAFLMSHFDEMKVKNPDGYQTYERLQRPENRHVRIMVMNRGARILDKMLDNLLPGSEVNIIHGYGDTFGIVRLPK